MGADDYVTKPFSPKELIARIRAVLQRRSELQKAGAKSGSVLKNRALQVDLGSHRVTIEDEEVLLTLTEFNILRELLSHCGSVLSRNHLMDKAIGSDIIVTDRTIDVHVAALRKKLGTYGDFIETVRGVGYRFKE